MRGAKLEASRSNRNRRCSSTCSSRGRGNYKASTHDGRDGGRWWYLSTERLAELGQGSSPPPCSPSCPDPTTAVPAASHRVWLCSSLWSSLCKYFQSQMSLLYLSTKLNLVYLYLEEFGGVVGDFFFPLVFFPQGVSLWLLLFLSGCYC